MNVAIGVWLLLEALLNLTINLPKYAKQNNAGGIIIVLLITAWLIVAGIWIL